MKNTNIFALSALCLALAACGGGSSDSGNSNPGGENPANPGGENPANPGSVEGCEGGYNQALGKCNTDGGPSENISSSRHLVGIEVIGYGAHVNLPLLTVDTGEKPSFPLEVMAGYEADISGCGASADGGMIVFESVNDDCTATVHVSPETDDTVLVTALPSTTVGSSGGRIVPSEAVIPRGGSATLKVAANPGFVPEIATTSGCDASIAGDILSITDAAENCAVDVLFDVRSPGLIKLSFDVSEGGYVDIHTKENERSIFRVPTGESTVALEHRTFLHLLDPAPAKGYDAAYTDTDCDNSRVPEHSDSEMIEVRGECSINVTFFKGDKSDEPRTPLNITRFSPEGASSSVLWVYAGSSAQIAIADTWGGNPLASIGLGGNIVPYEMLAKKAVPSDSPLSGDIIEPESNGCYTVPSLHLSAAQCDAIYDAEAGLLTTPPLSTESSAGALYGSTAVDEIY
ncbi:hypothetical protein [Gilvimarinus sp. 1_MG-2023]|uniref:hypothetical protein n=1 Tax=Gilvimarinus sp. 1_MG-2023 TaxID=3062638 RepID=UPI0026E3B89C|nr:hypothetical protein [Gilvimarinus sp. 1_MG-2023]MDO6747827.1 hypothetical protein [Gilvimarinus sp. 1_MG-2023]